MSILDGMRGGDCAILQSYEVEHMDEHELRKVVASLLEHLNLEVFVSRDEYGDDGYFTVMESEK